MLAIKILEIIGWSLAILVMLYAVWHRVTAPFKINKSLKRERYIINLIRYDPDIRKAITDLIEEEYKVEKNDLDE